MKKILLLLILISCSTTKNENTLKNQSLKYDDLVLLFNDWRNFENPPLLDGAPDYTRERFEKDQSEFLELRERLKVVEKWVIGAAAVLAAGVTVIGFATNISKAYL